MGVVMAIAAVAIVGTVAADIGFSVEESKKKAELKTAMNNASAAIDETNAFYKNVYKYIQVRLEHLKQSIRKLPVRAVHLLKDDLTADLPSDSVDKVIEYVGYAFGAGAGVSGLTGLVTSLVTRAGIAAADGIVAGIGAIAGGVGAVLAVVGFGMALYNGITELDKLDDAIDKVNHKRHEAEASLTKMEKSLARLLRSMKLEVGNYEELKDISDAWAKLAKNFDRYSNAFYHAMIHFAKGNSEATVQEILKSHGCPLKRDVLDLAKLIEENIVSLMREGFQDEEIINYFADDNPKDLYILLDANFVAEFREMFHL